MADDCDRVRFKLTGGSMISDSHQGMTIALEQALAAQDRMHGTVREESQQANLIYAMQEIRPANHTELAFVVWAGTRHGFSQPIVDDYCHRRAGLPSSLFDHPLLSLYGWCMPDTSRILVFREQLEALAKQLTGNRHGRDIVNGIYQNERSIRGISPLDFRGLIDPVNGLAEAEVSQFYDYLKERYAESLPYVWCSTIVERAVQTENCEYAV
jgi:hypothetical protein